ncbi:hypothetical protein HDU85_002240 [Gaertneriomyces sp. JEL0708]|nr:hypothetical protein HDU85_002240 [Gaertneriomyces sp. JEL0708]
MVMVISVTGQNMGAMRLSDALASFDSTTHDLHLVNANQSPPVCRIVSRKDAFDKARAKKRPEELDLEVKKLILKGGKKARKSLAETHGIEALQQQRKSHANVLKEVEVNSNISTHDLEIKLRKARDMLEKTCRVQFSIIDKKDGKSQGLLAYIEDHLKPISRIAGHPNVSGRKLQATFVPTKTQ